MNNKILNFIGICKKSGKISLGYDSVLDAIKSKKAFLVLIASDLSVKTAKHIDKITDTFFIEKLKLNENIESIYRTIGKSVGVISVNDEELAKKLKTLYRESKEDHIL